jgi:Flp pilus assembly protein TadB
MQVRSAAVWWQPSSVPVGKDEHARRLRIHWAWVPAAIFAVVVAWFRYGWVTTLFLIAAGLSLAAYAEWRAARRRRTFER